MSATLDVSVISTLQLLTLKGAADTQGHAVAIGKNVFTSNFLPGSGSVICPPSD